MRRVALWAMLAALAAGCRGETSEADPYVVRVDVRPQIRAFGEDTATADEAGEQLAQMGPVVIPALAAALTREPKDIRLKTVEVLSEIGTGDAVPPLLQAVAHDADEDVRADALRALGAIGDERGRDAVEAALADPRLTIRVGGIMGCAGLCTSPQTVDRLAEIAVRDQNIAAALAARATLATIRAKGAPREQAVRAAIELRRPAALPASATPDQRALAALLASDLDGTDGVPGLVAALDEASAPLQRQLVWRLGVVGDARAVAPLGRLLETKDPTVRDYVYDALVKLRERGVDGAGEGLARYAGRKPVGPMSPPEY